ncbi:MAG TPA: hypothetical protein VF631_13260 [Allosphingosinicella sp.]|jgi:hypothetical protein|uniref:hypothetical protein n=1 Tax=Allosphingosinicella sp. TaxID=2823234 RepID=UPI002F2909DF
MRKALALFCICLPGALSAQDRPGLPPVGPGEVRPGLPDVNPRRFDADPRDNLQAAFSSFGAWYRGNNRPRILLFWNRQLSDETTTRYRDRTRGSEITVARPGAVASAYDQVSEQERTTGKTYSELHPDDDGEFETGFLSAFASAGADMIDRSALMRKVSTGHGQGDRSDQQFMESIALEQGIEYLVEVLPDYRASSKTGMMFTVKITHLPSSAVRAQFRSEGRPEAGPERLVARAGGFRRERDERLSSENVAEALAAETMRRFR